MKKILVLCLFLVGCGKNAEGTGSISANWESSEADLEFSNVNMGNNEANLRFGQHKSVTYVYLVGSKSEGSMTISATKRWPEIPMTYQYKVSGDTLTLCNDKCIMLARSSKKVMFQ